MGVEQSTGERRTRFSAFLSELWFLSFTLLRPVYAKGLRVAVFGQLLWFIGYFS